MPRKRTLADIVGTDMMTDLAYTGVYAKLNNGLFDADSPAFIGPNTLQRVPKGYDYVEACNIIRLKRQRMRTLPASYVAAKIIREANDFRILAKSMKPAATASAATTVTVFG